ncbi:MAG: radical SAM protein [Candidatus Diapherotrites archaeon]|nr:radical SAM protein [Candidatus Diapherotrites archaeon]
MKTVYGPVPSWRLGKSLGIDPICEKACSFDCIYCQVGRAESKIAKRKKFVDGKKVERELQQALQKTKPDTITFSGMGEPTLALNLAEIQEIARNNSDHPIAILTNSSLLSIKEVRKDLQAFDIVCAKLDACNSRLFQKINRPAEGITFEQTLGGIKKFRTGFNGKLALQVMFIAQNKGNAKDMALLAEEIKPDEIQINTPLRHCPVKPLSKKEIGLIKREFKGLNVVSVYDAKKPDAKALDLQETLQRRPSERQGNLLIS